MKGACARHGTALEFSSAVKTSGSLPLLKIGSTAKALVVVVVALLIGVTGGLGGPEKILGMLP